MPARYRRSRRRTPMRRRRRMARRNTAQRYFRQRFTKIIPVESSQSSGQVVGGFALQQVSNVGATSPHVFGFDSSNRWYNVFNNYEAYAVTGMKLKWIPTNLAGGVRSSTTGELVSGTGTINSTSSVSNLGTQFVWFDMDTYDTTGYDIPRIAALDKSWNFDPKRSWSKYFSARRLSRAQSCVWQDTRTYAANQANSLTNASVGFFQPYKGMGEGVNDVFGYFRVTWYVTLKGQAYL